MKTSFPEGLALPSGPVLLLPKVHSTRAMCPLWRVKPSLLQPWKHVGGHSYPLPYVQQSLLYLHSWGSRL